VNPLRRRQVLESMLAEIPEVRGALEEIRRRPRQLHLSAVRSSRDPRRAMYIHTDVTVIRQQRFPRVEAHPHAQRAFSQRVLRFGGRCHRVARGRERDEERVALRVHLDTPVPRNRIPHPLPVPRQFARVLLRPQLVQERCRLLHICEEERDGAAREVFSHAELIIEPGWVSRLVRQSARRASDPALRVLAKGGVKNGSDGPRTRALPR
jgi:hypothetical protein